MRSDFESEAVVASLNVGSAGPGAGVDLADCGEADVHVAAGAVGATYSIEESDDDAAYTAAADADVLAFDANGLVQHANGLTLGPDEVGRLGYIGYKRYIRVVTTAADGAGFVEKSRLRHGNAPVA